jgi:photosystem II stability/assembly factor-like uncharacterized protein
MKSSFLTYILLIFSTCLLNAQNPNWSTQTFDSGYLVDVVFVDTLYGWTVGTGGKIFQSTDGGNTWTAQIHVTNNNLHGVSFVNRDVGYAVGDNGTFLKTTNGGAGWSVQTTVPAYNWSKVHFANDTLGWIVGGTALGIRQTTDGGSTWNIVSSTGQFEDLWFLQQSNHGWAVGNVGIRHTVDGTNWTDLNSTSNAYSISFPTDSIGYEIDVYTGGAEMVTKIFKSMDGGRNWNVLDTLHNTFLQNVFFSDTLEGLATGWSCMTGTNCGLDAGIIYRTTDGGFSWNKELDIASALLYRIFILDSNNGWAVGGIPGGAGMVVCRFRKTATGVKEHNVVAPSSFSLSQNFPNPFNPTTKIDFRLSKPSFVMLKVYDLLGREVATLMNEKKEQGEHSLSWGAEGVPSGVYFYRLVAGDFIETKKMVVAR